MAMYKVKEGQKKAEMLDEFEFTLEGKIDFSPQRILIENPGMITNLPELELMNTEVFITYPEYTTASGNIDLLIIGSNAEIIIIETKLLKNPESTRQVVAQIIDYIKAFSEETIDEFIRKTKLKFPDAGKQLENSINLAALLEKNITTGNYKVLVVGDYIHPNVLGMIKSIHSAPHLAFTIHLVDLYSCLLSADEIIIKPGIVASTVEVERSVIRIEIEPSKIDYRITAQTPEPKGKGARPIITWEQYLDNIRNNQFRSIIEKFQREWIDEIDESINMGQVGFSAGLQYEGKRIPIQYVYDNRLILISDKYRRTYNISNSLFEDYLDDLKQSPLLYDKYLASGKVTIPFSDIDEEILTIILNSALKLAKRFKSADDYSSKDL